MGGQFFGGAGGGGTPGDAPGGAAGGDLSGAYPNPGVANLNGVAAASYALLAGPTFTGTVTLPTGTVTSGMILDGTIVSADLNSAAGITSGQLAGSIAPSKVTGTAVTAADTGTVTSTMLLDGTILNADVNASAAVAYSKLNLGSSIVDSDLSDLGVHRPQDYGYTTWSFDPTTGASQATIGAGVLKMNRVKWPKTATITKACTIVTTLGSGLSNCWIGVYTSTGTLIGTSADQSTAFASTGAVNATLSAAGGQSITNVTGGSGVFLYVGILMGAGSSLQLAIVPGAGNTIAGNLGLTAASSVTCQSGSGQTSLPSSVTMSGVSQQPNPYFMALI